MPLVNVFYGYIALLDLFYGYNISYNLFHTGICHSEQSESMFLDHIPLYLVQNKPFYKKAAILCKKRVYVELGNIYFPLF